MQCKSVRTDQCITFRKEVWGQTKRGAYHDLLDPWLKGAEEMEALSKSFWMIRSRLGHYSINVVVPETVCRRGPSERLARFSFVAKLKYYI